MRSVAFKVFFMALAVAVLGACARMVPIYNVADMPVMANKPNPTSEDVSKAIIRAGAGLGWQMQQAKPGLITGTLSVREHQAVIDIPYTVKSYSIQYKNSNNLGFDGQNIHKNYNGWIQNLDRAIKAQLSTL